MFKKLVLCSFLFYSFFAFSQIQYGVTTGLNMSRFNDKYQATNGGFFNPNSIGLRIGVFSEIAINEKITFSPKLIYNQIGDREKDFGDVPERGLDISTLDYKLDYLSIPLNLRFFNKFYVEIGPQIGVLLNEKPESLNIGEVDNTIDFGANLEIGYKINDFRLSLGVYHGFTNVFEIEEALPLISRNLNVRNFSFSFNLGYVVF